MIQVNDNFRQLPASYLFSEVSRRIREFLKCSPGREVIRMDIGDVTKPLIPSVIKALHEGVEELAESSSFHGYGPEQGYDFLREKISRYDYKERGLDIDKEEIFISDGAKSDIGNLGDIFSKDCRIAIMDPSYPVYVDDNVIDGRAGYPDKGRWSEIEYLNCNALNGFMPSLPDKKVDLIYLCFPNNPTGVAIGTNELRKWVDYARKEGSLIIYDSAYEAFVRDSSKVKSIYEIDGAEEVAIEIRSFSKTAGFTGLRCGYTVVPRKLKGIYRDGSEIELSTLWRRRQTTKFNGASYLSQKAASGIYTPEGQEMIKKNIDDYLANASLIRETFLKKGFLTFGGENSPYVWVRETGKTDSWDLFNYFLEEYGISTTPGSGFGRNGEGFLRLTGFNSREKTEEAMKRIIQM